MKIGLFLGSFNPIHVGHVAIANYMAEFTDLDRVWIVVSPRNPLKSKKNLMDAKKRLALTKKAIGKNPKIKVSDVEFSLPQPSYTINTLNFLKAKNPASTFVLLIGSDNLASFPTWKEYKKILNEYAIYVYPRNDSGTKAGKPILQHRNIKYMDAPTIDISSTSIRKALKQGKDVKRFIP